MTICVWPRLDVDVMLSMPAMVENCFSSGVATVAAMVCGLVPGSGALTVTVGKSTFGRSLTGSCRYATMPKTRMPIMTSVVMTGRLMNSVVKFIYDKSQSQRSTASPQRLAETQRKFKRFTAEDRGDARKSNIIV